jgi:hypothetical protein
MMTGTIVNLSGTSRLTVEKDCTKIEKNIGTKENPVWKLEMMASNKNRKEQIK